MLFNFYFNLASLCGKTGKNSFPFLHKSFLCFLPPYIFLYSVAPFFFFTNASLEERKKYSQDSLHSSEHLNYLHIPCPYC